MAHLGTTIDRMDGICRVLLAQARAADIAPQQWPAGGVDSGARLEARIVEGDGGLCLVVVIDEVRYAIHTNGAGTPLHLTRYTE